MTRDVVLSVLLAVNRGSAVDTTLHTAVKKAGFDRRDTAFCHALTYGVLQKRFKLDSVILHFSSLKLNKIAPKVLEILRIGAYQMLYMDKIPHSAAVNESVKLARKHANPRAAGFVNAILRKISASCETGLPETDRKDLTAYLHVEYSFPVWFVDVMRARLGDADAEAFFAASNAEPPVTARLNTLVCDPQRAKEILSEEGIVCTDTEFAPETVYLSNVGNVEESKAFRDGVFTIQDTASQLCVYALDPKPGFSVLDVCAAPGGKSFASAALTGNASDIRSFDAASGKLAAMDEHAKRLRVSSMRTACMDASVHVSALENSADYLICDVPCSGLGVIRKKPDIRYKNVEDIRKLPSLQTKIIDNVSSYVKPGGVLVYSTCTILREENEAIVEAFLASHPEFSLEAFTLPGIGSVSEGFITLYPHIHQTDGFFIAKLRKK